MGAHAICLLNFVANISIELLKWRLHSSADQPPVQSRWNQCAPQPIIETYRAVVESMMKLHLVNWGWIYNSSVWMVVRTVMIETVRNYCSVTKRDVKIIGSICRIKSRAWKMWDDLTFSVDRRYPVVLVKWQLIPLWCGLRAPILVWRRPWRVVPPCELFCMPSCEVHRS